MKRALSLIFFVCLTGFVFSKSDDLEEVYVQIDAAIAASDVVVQQREVRIKELKAQLPAADDKRKFDLNFKIFEAYSAYVNDSAMSALRRCIDIAERSQKPHDASRCKALLALQFSKVGLYTEALTTLEELSAYPLDRQALEEYYVASNHVYGELAVYSNIGDMREKYFHIADAYRDSIYAVMRADSEVALTKRETDALNAGDYAKALDLNDKRLQQFRSGTHEYGVVAFYRYLIYRKQGEHQKAIYWLAHSALCDVSNGVMDQAALWNLAQHLSNEGDEVRAHRYIRFAWQAAETFGTRVRSWQISPILNTIDLNYQHSIDRQNSQLLVFSSLIAILAILLFVLLAYVMKHRNKLNQINRKLFEVNAQLNESNRVKEAYIGRFIGMCSLYIDKMEGRRKQINKLMLSGQYDEVKKLTKSVEATNHEVDELYENFDTVFLGLFPGFIEEFNTLLRPEAQIRLSTPGILTTPVRIFALIRLGVDDSAKIAEFLHYSVNTIYNYRAKIKNGAIGDRNLFENEVKKLCSHDNPES